MPSHQSAESAALSNPAVDVSDPEVARLIEQLSEYQRQIAGDDPAGGEGGIDRDGLAQPAPPTQSSQQRRTESRVEPLSISNTDTADQAILAGSSAAPEEEEDIASWNGGASASTAEPRPTDRAAIDRLLTKVRSNPNSPVSAFDQELLALIFGDSTGPADYSQLRPEDARILAVLRQQLSAFRSGLNGNSRAKASARIAPILEAAQQLRRETGLTLPTVTLCHTVTGFGDYREMQPTFQVGRVQPVVLYVELDNFESIETDDGQFETKLSLTAVLYDPDGRPVFSLPESPVVDRNRRQRRDFYLCGPLKLPATIRPGDHTLKVTVKDEHGDRVAQQSIKLAFTPNR